MRQGSEKNLEVSDSPLPKLIHYKRVQHQFCSMFTEVKKRCAALEIKGISAATSGAGRLSDERLGHD